MEQILNKKKPFTAGGKDKLPNGFLKVLGPKFCQAIAVLTSTCWRLEYFPEKFKNAKIVCLRKPGKGIYNQAKAWRPIALLNTTGKLMEAITAARLSKVAEEAKLLPEIQMGFRKGRSTESALFLLTSQVEKVWKEGMVASLLSLDISGVYDRVLPEILQKILERKGIPLWLTSWIFSFCTRRTTTLVFDDSESSSIPIHCRVPQDSPLSPILFLFYISELHETVHSPTTGVSALGVADDTNLLAFEHSLKSNLLKLKNTHLKCLSWAARHGIVFSPEKYKILHFSRRRSDNLQLKLRLGNVILKPKEEVQVLGVYLDAKLHWHKHQRIILQKAQKALSSLSRTSYSTWGFPVLTVSQFWPSCISGTSHAPCWEVSSALLPVCSAVSPAYKNFSCSPSFFSSSFLFSFLVFHLVHQSKSQVSSQVRSRLPNQLGLSSALLLPCHTMKDLPNHNTLHQAMFTSLSCLNNQTKPCQLLEMISSFTTCLQNSCKFKLLTLLPSPSLNTLLTQRSSVAMVETRKSCMRSLRASSCHCHSR